VGADVMSCWTLASNQELNQGRAIVGVWLQGELAQRFGIPVPYVEHVMGSMPTNYALLLDTAEGVNIIAQAVATLLGQPTTPFYTRLQ
jgi:hypothetical protein